MSNSFSFKKKNVFKLCIDLIIYLRRRRIHNSDYYTYLHV
jgi:hypothetical protein